MFSSRASKWDDPAVLAPHTVTKEHDGIAVTSSAESQKVINARLARTYAELYDAGDYDRIPTLLAPDADCASLWGVHHGQMAWRIFLEEEKKWNIVWHRRPGCGPGGFFQITDHLFEREGRARRADRSFVYFPVDYLNAMTVRETLVVKQGRIRSRVMQKLPRTQTFYTGVSA